MKYDLVKPCPTCPFRRAHTGIRLTEGRIEELCDGAGSAGREFACHKTVDYDREDDDGEPVFHPTDDQSHCAGALIFGLKQGGPHQMGRIAERLRMWDARVHEPYFDDVFDDMFEMMETAVHRPKRRNRRAR